MEEEEHTIDGGQAAILAQHVRRMLSDMRADKKLLQVIPAKQRRELVAEIRLTLDALTGVTRSTP